MFDDVMVRIVAAVLCALLLSLCSVIVAGAYRIATNVATAEDVMKACKETSMYLHKGYAISCKVLENNP
jgi:hypothetical protein